MNQTRPRRRAAAALAFAAALLIALPPSASTQGADLHVVQAAPNGELAQLQDANEIRVIFSEPMVTLGRIPANPAPPWIHMTPAIKGTYRWSGTTVLIFTPDSATPLPRSTRVTVTIDRTATSDAGHTLAGPFEFSFTTPTLKLTSMRWYRRDNRADRPVVLVLQFNQPVRPADVATHVSVRYQPHEFDAPALAARDRARMNAADATERARSTNPDQFRGGVARFMAKVAAARNTAARRDPLSTRITTDWDRVKFPASNDLVALETTTVPPAGAWLQLTLDTGATGVEGTARPAQAQTSVAELAPVFFANGFSCRSACDPSSYNGIDLTGDVDISKFATALTVRDVTAPAAERTVARASAVKSAPLDSSSSPSVEDAGYDRQPPARTFAYRLDPSLQALDGQTLDYPWINIVENWRERAFTSFGDGHGVWESGGGPQLPFYSRNFRDVTQWLTALSIGDLVPRIVALEKNEFKDVPPGAGNPRRLNVTPDATQSYGIDLTPVLSPTSTGLVWAGMRPGDPIARAARAVPADRADRSTIVQVTNLGLSVKDSPQSTLVFVTRLDNGDAVGDATVTIINTSNQQVWRGTTGRDGVAMAPALPLRKTTDWDALSFVVTAEKDGDIGYLASNWNEGIMPWDFGHPYELWEATDILRGSIFADRGVYKPGEDVHVKAIVRSDTPNGVRLLPAGSRLDVHVTDSRNREVDRRSVTVNRWSSAEWTWTVPADGTLGNYRVRAVLPSDSQTTAGDSSGRRPEGEWLREVSGSFLVAAYRRPDFRVDTTLQAPAAVAGNTLSGTLNATYLFGSTMNGRAVRWSVTRQPDLEIPQPIVDRFPEDRYQFGYYPDDERGTERTAGADGTLDANGRLQVTAPTVKDVDVAYRYTFEGDVEDVSRQHIANRSSLVVHPAPWYIGVRRPSYFVDTAAGTNLDVVAADLSGNAVAGVPVNVTLTRIQWNSVRHAEGGGFYSWDTEEVRVPAGEWTVTTAATPVALQIPVPEGGYYELTAEAHDADGHRTKTEVSFYGLGKGYTAWQRYDHNRITLEPEKKVWSPGETARLMIQSPWETATALVTLEREGVRRYQRFALTSTQQTVEVPITEADIPNVYVSVLLIRGRTSNDPGTDGTDPGKPSFRLGYAELTIADKTKQLAVKVSADRNEYRPANVAHVAVAVTDAASRPAASEVTLWAVDYGVLSLTNYHAPDVLHAIYQEKALQVMNEDSRQRIVSRRVLTPKGDGEGGGGGADEGAGNFRRDFRPLAFWLGSVETDASGTAARDVTLPESLTTYRIMAVAGDAASRFGSNDVEIKVNKPITLLAAFPRFMTLGDRASFGATLTNTLQTGGTATVTIRSLDPTLVQFQGAASQTMPIGAASTEPVRFDAVARGTGTARVQMTVALAGETDAFDTTLVVSAPASLETVADFGDTDGRAAQRLALPHNIVPSLGGLNVQLASTALVGLGEGAQYLADYAYGCAEQKASAALALSLSSALGGAFSMARVRPEEYRARAVSLLNELPRFQCENGGFAYWPGACSVGNVYLTSYVLHVMKVAESLGIAADKDTVDRALGFLEDELKKTTAPGQVQWLPIWSASNAFSVKVLAEYGRPQDSNIARLLSSADRMPIFALSYLADALAASGTRDARYDDVVRRITNAMRVDGDQAHVEEIDQDALVWLWNSNVRASAVVLEGLVRRGDDPLLVQRLVRWLLAARKGGRWNNTQDNATALEALVAYYRKYETDVPDMTATTSIGARPIGTATFRGRSSAAQQVQLAMPDLLQQVPAGAERELAFARNGTGRLFYSTRLQYATTDPPAAADLGMHVERTYERYVENGTGTPATAFNAGDLIRVTLTITTPAERRFVAVTDRLPAGVEAVDSWFQTTAADVAKDASVDSSDTGALWFEHGGFDHVEKFDDHVSLFATRLGQGRHQFSYLVRATTNGTFRAAGTIAEEMYAPEVNGRSAAATLEVR